MFTHSQILELLTAPSAESLFQTARDIRFRTKGNAIFLRGLIELSNICDRNCCYCGMRHDNPAVHRYAMKDDEIVACAQLAHELNFGTVVLQAGESQQLFTQARVAHLINRIKCETGQHITLSLGERTPEELDTWKRAGADRYLLRFETSDLDLFHRIHPDEHRSTSNPRIELLKRMREMGYEIGSGIMLGIPGQSLDSVVDDLETIAALKLDMVGLGPYIAHPETPLGQLPKNTEVPVSVDFTCRCYAIVRCLLPEANIPSTTALSSIDPKNGRRAGLTSGANVFMPNLTPAYYRSDYQIYPGKICTIAPAQDSMAALHALFKELQLVPTRA